MLRRKCRRTATALTILTIGLTLLYWLSGSGYDQQISGPALAPPRLDGDADDKAEADESAESVRQELELLEAEKLADEARLKLGKHRQLQQRRQQLKQVHTFNSGTVQVLESSLNDTEAHNAGCAAQNEYEALVGDVTVGCSRRRRLGLEGDGGWYFCDVGPFRPTRGACLVMSFGVGDTWKFDDEAADKLKCRVLAFDPSVSGPARRSSGVRFFRVGVAGFSGRLGNWTVDTVDGLASRLTKDNVDIDLLKLDVETSEWTALEAATDATLSRVKQLAMELHTQELLPLPNRETSDAQYRRYSRLLRRLRRLGFRLWLSEPNSHGVFYSAACNWRTSVCCRNVNFLNVNFLPKAEDSRVVEIVRDIRLLTSRQLPTLPTRLTAAGAEAAFFDVVGADTAVCKRRRRIGPQRDGGYDLCFAEAFQLRPGCRVYSFGVGNQFGFEDSLAEQFACRVRMFDPSMSQVEHKRSKFEWFHPVGIGADDSVRSNGWQVRTLASLLKRFNDELEVIDALKIDVEFDEWSALETAIRDGSLKRVKQLVLETHLREIVGGVSSASDFVRQIGVWYDLHRLGFRQWRHSQNWRVGFRGAGGVSRPCCHEHSLVNANFIG